MKRVLVINCNTSEHMTHEIAEIARQAAGPDITIVPVTPPFGPESVEGYYESFVAAAGMLAAVESQTEPFDGIILAGFGDHGREAMRQRWNIPVVDITEAAPTLANLVSHRFGIVTTLASTVPGIWESLKNAGLHTRCINVYAANVPVTAIHGAAREVADTLEHHARVLLEEGAEAIVLGCAGFAGLDDELSSRLGVPVIDGVDAAARLMALLLTSGLQTSKVGAYRTLNLAKNWVEWKLASPAMRAVSAEPSANSFASDHFVATSRKHMTPMLTVLPSGTGCTSCSAECGLQRGLSDKRCVGSGGFHH